MLLITETIDQQDLDIICEQTEDGVIKSFKLKGPFLQAEQKNKNGRIYSQKLIEREVSKFNEEKIKTKRAFGECDHPLSPSVNLQNVSHLIESLEMDNHTGVGVAKVLDTNKGKIISSILKAGGRIGMSTRGVGSLTGFNVNEDYSMITVDAVADNSAPGCVVDGIFEGKEWIIDGNRFVEKAVEKLEENLAKHGSRDILRDLQTFLKSINF